MIWSSDYLILDNSGRRLATPAVHAWPPKVWCGACQLKRGWETRGDLRVSIRKDRHLRDEVVIEGDGDDLRYLIELCLNLSQMTDEDVRTGNNHCHIAEYRNNAAQGLVPTR